MAALSVALPSAPTGAADFASAKPQTGRKTIMSKKTAYHSTNGSFTGKTVTERSGGSTKSTNYKATGSGLSRTIMGPGWKATSTTSTDSKGNTRTKKY